MKLLCNFIEIALRHECSPVNVLQIFKTTFPKNTSGWLLLAVVKLLSVQSLTYLKLGINFREDLFFFEAQKKTLFHLY